MLDKRASRVDSEDLKWSQVYHSHSSPASATLRFGRNIVNLTFIAKRHDLKMRSVVAVVATLALIQSASALPTLDKRTDAQAKPKGQLEAKYAVTPQTECLFHSSYCNPFSNDFNINDYINQRPNFWFHPIPDRNIPPPYQIPDWSQWPNFYGPSRWPTFPTDWTNPPGTTQSYTPTNQQLPPAFLDGVN
ncbi:hypothetical protein PtA15_11A108 [Puccinia triticina]|uniref:Uncharacterized protein n=1 Tax=Puccinia triticina TaxID=208348 RepID=A0ABY7D059_9BASI|nr:uncharacterized protein PtA15_11A108 [Puccinia triticina]WAQ89420.1 hypothetical protein PtA15_11A108 [Puccinia triticina]